MREEDVNYEWINLYSNGIRIGESQQFCDTYLRRWHNLSLQTVYITVHNLDEKKNAKRYGVKEYPPLREIVSRIHEAELKIRANVVLSRDNVGSLEEYVAMVEGLRSRGFDHISAWPIRNENDVLDPRLSPSEGDLEKMCAWAKEHDTSYCRLRVLGVKSHEVYEKGEKLTLFPDGSLSNSWCNS
jgi:MoaA/NifB/PqqE/SkfB family radical SAM enzyme